MRDAQPPAQQSRVVLTIAGFDPSSGAGVTADLQTFAAHGFFGCSSPTAITVQSTVGVRRVQALSGLLVQEVLETLEVDLPPEGIKIGMLATAEVAAAVCDFLVEVRARRRTLVILDPVLLSSSGAELLEARGLDLVRERLMPLCDVATPNQVELFALLGRQREGGDVLQAAQELSELYPLLGVVVTGGDATSPSDLLVRTGTEPIWIEGRRVETTSTHGTGCAYSSALLCRMLLGDDLERAARRAKAFVEASLRSAVAVGHGRGPMNLLWTRPLRKMEDSG